MSALIVSANIELMAGSFDLSNTKGSTTYGITTVIGKVRNNSGSTCDLFSITCKLLNRSGEIVGRSC